jgi:hypothetical protein
LQNGAPDLIDLSIYLPFAISFMSLALCGSQVFIEIYASDSIQHRLDFNDLLESFRPFNSFLQERKYPFSTFSNLRLAENVTPSSNSKMDTHVYRHSATRRRIVSTSRLHNVRYVWEETRSLSGGGAKVVGGDEDACEEAERICNGQKTDWDNR